MNISLTSDDSIRGIITVAIEKKDYEKDVDKNLRLYRRKMTLPGFRKGTAPMGMIRRVYGKRVLADEINRLTSEHLFKYIRDNRLGIMGEPLPKADQEPINFDTQEEFKIQFDVALAPKMTDVKLTKEDHLNGTTSVWTTRCWISKSMPIVRIKGRQKHRRRWSVRIG